jgi:hypothetical protein
VSSISFLGAWCLVLGAWWRYELHTDKVANESPIMAGCVLRVRAVENDEIWSDLIGLGLEMNSADEGVLEISNSSRERLNDQVDDAIAFILSHSDLLDRMARRKNQTSACVDFAVWSTDRMAVFYRFPVPLLRLLSQYSIDLELSVYRSDLI